MKAPTAGETVRRLTRCFQEAGLEMPQLDARVLTAEACGLTREDLIAKRDILLSIAQVQTANRHAARRLAGEPVSRIAGRREFWGLSFKISPDTLDPRPETELLVEAVLDYAKREALSDAPIRILDLGTGSGCILGALLSELPAAYGFAVDRSFAALEVARENMSQLGLLDRSAFLCAEWLGALGDGYFDAVLCNPPYIASSEIEALEIGVKAFDPRIALDGGKDGLEAYRQILPPAFGMLKRKGIMAFETGFRQAKTVRELMCAFASGSCGFDTRILTDMSGIERVVAGVRQS